jgi:hypothetical protein
LLGISPGDNIQALLHALMDHSTAAICNAHGRHEVPEVVQFIFRDEVRTRLGSTTNARDYTLDDLASLITDIECRIIERVNVSKQQIRSKSSPPAKKPRAMVAAMGVRAPNQENAPEQRPIKKHAHLVCFNCLQRGHIAVNCPSAPANKAATRSFCIVCGLSDHMCESCPQRKRSPVDKHTYLDL